MTLTAPLPSSTRPPEPGLDVVPAAVAAAAGLSTRPDALLLDFGGVVFETSKRPDGMATMAAHVADVLARGGQRFTVEELLPVLQGGQIALKHWKHAQSRRLEPAELDHRTIWRDFYGSPLPEAAREILAGSAGALQQRLTATLAEHAVRPGIPELLDLADALGVPVGIVSNAHSGRAHRALLAEHGLQDRFAVQVYSDEVGIRKPHPGIVELAARALGTTAARCWYVGDTQDRDVVAGRRAHVAAVVLTRHTHTDDPPFPVREVADAVLPTPADLVPLLRAARPAVDPLPAPLPNPGTSPDPTPEAATTPGSARDTALPSAILLDHGGVIAVSTPDDEVRRGFAEHLAQQLSRAGYPTSTDGVLRALDEARARHRAWKHAHETSGRSLGSPVPEIDAATFWVELVAPCLDDVGTVRSDDVRRAGLRDWLRAECHDLMVRYARSKSVPTLRPGVRELLARARAAGVPVAVVSNTVCGRAVRDELVAEGLDELVGAHVYSDELGVRKPDPATARTALVALEADPARAWFVGDKPGRDVPAARGAEVGTVVLVRGGSTPDAELDALVAPGSAAARGRTTPDHVVDGITELLPLILP
ncbi:HAD-IA family hydrolase [Cellulosimicrobium cellulans]|uniref:HAD-IA family hydrolase n=1 Tax=Cellulosimicrobium cellulans TaxID=1710 RepID=UPI0037FEA030